MRFVRPPRLPGSSDNLRRRWRYARWIWRSLAGAVGVLVLAGLSMHMLLLHCLDQPWLKHRLLGLARTSLGVELEYRVARIDLFSGADIDGLVIATPAEFRSFAPDLLRVGHVEARWSLTSLLRDRPLVDRVLVSDVSVTVAMDEGGKTSFDALLPPRTAPEPTVPLSRRASTFLAAAPPVGRAEIDRVSLALVRIDHRAIVERMDLQGLSLAFIASPAAPTDAGWRAVVSLGASASPLVLELARMRPDSPAAVARAKLWALIEASSHAMSTTLDLRMIDQTLLSSISADHWLHAEARLRFDPTAGRTDVNLDPVEAADGAARVEASVEVPDVGDPIVRHGRGNVDLARLLGWLPPDLVPVTAERAQARWQVDSLVVGPVLALSSGATVAVDVDVSNLAVPFPSGSLQVVGAALSAHAQSPEQGRIMTAGSLKLDGVRVAMGTDRTAADGVTLDFDGQQAAGGEVAGHVGLRFASVERAGNPSGIARDGQLDLRVDHLHIDTREPLATQGDVALSMGLASIDGAFSGTRTTLDALTLHGHTALQGRAPYAAELDAGAARVHVVARDGRTALDGPARIDAKVHDVTLDPSHPESSLGTVALTVDASGAQTSLDARKRADALEFALQAKTGSLNALRPFLPASLVDEAPWDRMAVSVRSTGQVENLAGNLPSLQQTTEIDIDNPAFGNVAARSLSLKVKSQGTALQHQADVDLLVPGLSIGGGRPSDDHLTLSAALDRPRTSLNFKVSSEGHANTKLAGSLSFDPKRRALLYEAEGHLGGLASLATLAAKTKGLEGFDLSRLEVGLSARGAVLGVVAGVARDGTVTLEPHPTRTAAVDGKTELRVDHLRWARGDTAIRTPAMVWHGEMRATGPRRTLESHVEVGTLHLDLGSRDVDLNGIRDEASVSVAGDLMDPDLEVEHHLAVGAVTQDVVPEYPVGDIALALSAQRSPEGMVHISDLKLTNGLGGTVLSLSGNVDLGEGRRTLSVTTSATQDLARLSTIPERFKGRGSVAVEANVTSPNLALYQVRAAVKGEDVNVTLPGSGVALDSANGDVPINVQLEVTGNTVALKRSADRSPYSMLRFADQHPLLAHSGFLSIAHLKTPFVSIAPLVGNLSIDENVVALRQFEMGVRGGTITGQCGLDWNGLKSTVELHVRASGVQSSHGEPFDGNIAVSISAADRTIEGRAEILRIGVRHLLDLLDMQDPLHVDPAMNRIRTALNFGYPDNLRLVFDHGFASAHLQLGGLARLISISEIRGIPMGPIIDKMIASMLEEGEAKEAM